MVHGYSCGLAVVVLPEAAQPLLAAYPAAAVAGGSVGAGKQEHLPFCPDDSCRRENVLRILPALSAALPPPRAPLGEAFLLHRAHPTLGECVPIRTA